MPELFLPGRADQKALSPHPQGVFTRILGLDAQALQWRETLTNILKQVLLTIFGHDGEQWQTLKKVPDFYS